MHLLKSEGDSTLQGFESTYSFKVDGQMNLPALTLVQTMNWLRGAQGEKIILSGTNMPVTVLSLESQAEHGIKTFKITHDPAMTELMADNSDILAFRSIGQEASIIVTEEQILAVHKGGRVMRNHCHSVHASISKDFIVTIDEQRKMNIYNVASVMQNDITVVRQF